MSYLRSTFFTLIGFGFAACLFGAPFAPDGAAFSVGLFLLVAVAIEWRGRPGAGALFLAIHILPAGLFIWETPRYHHRCLTSIYFGEVLLILFFGSVLVAFLHGMLRWCHPGNRTVYLMAENRTARIADDGDGDGDTLSSW